MYIPFDDTKPEGADTPPVYADTDLANIRALRDGVVSGFLPAWALAVTFGPPDVYLWSKGVYRLRATVGYTSGLISSITWEFSENSGGAYANINTGGTAAPVTSDPSGLISAMGKDATSWVLALSAIQRAGKAGGDLTGHIAGVGAAVHGLGTVSTQNANAVNLTGGVIQALAATLLTRLTPAAPPTLASGANFDWAARPTQVEMAAGGTIAGLTNAQAGEMKRIIVIGNGAITINAGAGNTFTWGAGHPVWSTTLTLVNIIAKSPTAFYGTSIPF